MISFWGLMFMTKREYTVRIATAKSDMMKEYIDAVIERMKGGNVVEVTPEDIKANPEAWWASLPTPEKEA